MSIATAAIGIDRIGGACFTVEMSLDPEPRARLSVALSTLEQAAASLALALRQDGLTIETIAQLFGVTRQRNSALLRQKAALESPTSENP